MDRTNIIEKEAILTRLELKQYFEILNNYILYRDDVAEMLSIYTRNDIYDALSEIDPEKIVN